MSHLDRRLKRNSTYACRKGRASASGLLLVFIAAGVFGSGCRSVDTSQSRAAADQETAFRTVSGWSKLYHDDWSGALSDFQSGIGLSTDSGAPYRGGAVARIAASDTYDAYSFITGAVRNEPDSPYTLAMLKFALKEVPFEAVQYGGLVLALERAAHGSGVPEWMRREYREILFEYYYEKTGDFELAQQIKYELKAVDGWSILGPFSNVSGSGFARDFIDIGAEQPGGFAAADNGKNNRRLTPFVPAVPNPSLDVPLSDYLSGERYSSVYAFKELPISEAGIYEIVFRRNGALEAWLDGEKIVSDGSYLSGGNAVYAYSELAAGSHRLYVKVSNLEEASAFRVYLRPSQAYPFGPSDLYASLFPGPEVSDPLINEMCREIESGDDSGEGRFWLAQTLLDRGFPDRAAEVLEHAAGRNGNGILNRWISAVISMEQGEYEIYEQAMLELSGGGVFFAPAVIYAMHNYISNERFVRAEDYIGQISAKDDSWLHLLEAEIAYAFSRNDDKAAYDAFRRLYGTYGATGYACYLMLINGSDLNKEQEAAYLDILGRQGYFRQARFLDYRMNGDAPVDTVLEKLYSYLEHYPVDEDLWLEYIRGLYDLKEADFGFIRERTRQLTGVFPYSYDLLIEEMKQARSVYGSMYSYYLSNNNEETGENTSPDDFVAAMNNEKQHYRSVLQNLLAAYPSLYYSRDELRELDGKETFREKLTAGDSYTIIDEYNESGFEPGSSDAAVVFDDRKEIYFGDGSSSVFQHYILQVLTERGVENNRYQYLEFYPAFGEGYVEEAFILKKNGIKIRAERSGRKLAFPGLNPGDFIVMRYRSDGYMTGEINREIWSSCTMASVYPVFEKNFRLVYPRGTEMKMNFNNAEEDGIEIEKGDFIEDYSGILIKIRNTEGLLPGFFSKAWRDIVPWIDFSTVGSWTRIAEWYGRLYKGQTVASPSLRRVTAEVVGDAKTRTEKIRRIFNYVSGRIEYEDLDFQYSDFIPQTADSVLKEGYGDCKDQSVLLIAMLKIAGVDSYIVLNTPDYNGDTPFLPSPRFSHAIVAVAEPDGDMYLDPTTRYFTYQELPSGMEGSYVLPVKEDGTLVHLKHDISLQHTYYFLELNDLFEYPAVTGSVSYQGLSAGMIRNQLHGRTKSRMKEQFSLTMNAWLPGFGLDTLDVNNLEDLYYDPVVQFQGTLSGIVQPAAGSAVEIIMPWIGLLDAKVKMWLAVPEVQADIHVEHPVVSTPQTQTTVFHVPLGYSLAHLPEDLSLSFGDSYVRYKYEKKENSIICTRDIFIENQVVPGEKADEFRAFIRQAVFKERENLFLRK